MTRHNNDDKVEDAGAAIILAGQPVTFNDVAGRTGLGRATLYRNPDLRAIIEEHRPGQGSTHPRPASREIAHLRSRWRPSPATVRRHEEEDSLRRKTQTKRT